jgi:hypothetical protein
MRTQCSETSEDFQKQSAIGYCWMLGRLGSPDMPGHGYGGASFPLELLTSKHRLVVVKSRGSGPCTAHIFDNHFMNYSMQALHLSLGPYLLSLVQSTLCWSSCLAAFSYRIRMMVTFIP